MVLVFSAVAVDTLPLAGRDQGCGSAGPDIGAERHPLLSSPVEGEVPPCDWDAMVPTPDPEPQIWPSA
jgi:hypothetical protein